MSDQFKPRPVSDADLDRWDSEALAAIPRLVPGSLNWPVIVRSLVAEVRRLRVHSKDLEEQVSGIIDDMRAASERDSIT